jgi:molecular chaperone GrpE
MTDNASQVITEDVVEEAVEEVVPGQETDPVAALTADLQRLQAEYANYRKRVERDRAVAHELAIGSVLTELLATLDDIDRAADHNELTGGFKAVSTASKILQPGYKYKERILRPARVAVTEPEA